MKIRAISYYSTLTGGLLLLLVTVLLVPTWRTWRQARLNRQLINAIKQDHPYAALQALQDGADPNTRDKTLAPSVSILLAHLLLGKPLPPQRGNPALVLLLCDSTIDTVRPYKRYSLVHALLERGADPDPENDFGPPVVYAASSGDTRSLRALLKKGVCDHNPALCNSVLWQVIMEKDPQDVETLLKKGADVNYDPGRCNMLCYTVWAEDEATVNVLLRRGADPNIVCRRGVTALGEARASKLASIEQVLRQAGAMR